MDVVTFQLVNGSCTVPSVLVPDVIEKLLGFLRLRLQLRTSDSRAALNFSGIQIDEEAVERTVFLILSSARRKNTARKVQVPILSVAQRAASLRDSFARHAQFDAHPLVRHLMQTRAASQSLPFDCVP